MAKEEKRVYPKLYRFEENKIIAGVCGGLGNYFNVDPTIIRLAFVLVTIFGGSGVLIYLILWLVIPTKSNSKTENGDHIKENIEEIKEKARSLSHDDSRFLVGIIILVFGTALLLGNFGFWQLFNLGKLWPVLLIIAGAILLTHRNERD